MILAWIGGVTAAMEAAHRAGMSQKRMNEIMEQAGLLGNGGRMIPPPAAISHWDVEMARMMGASARPRAAKKPERPIVLTLVGFCERDGFLRFGLTEADVLQADLDIVAQRAVERHCTRCLERVRIA